MKLRKFQAATIKDAVSEVKAAFGPDAMIVATKQLKNGVEVTAAIDDDEPKLETVEPPTANAVDPAGLERAMAPLYSEIRSLRSQLKTSSHDSRHDELRTEMNAMREAFNRTDNFGARNSVHREALAQLARENRIALPSERTRIALVGPTGVGKTTTIAKLAARAALIDGMTTAIVSVDTYRVGGEAQMRIFASLIGVPLVVVRDLHELPARMKQLGAYDRVFLDTPGRSPRDKSALSELVQVLADVADLETHLTIAAGTSSTALDAWLQRLGAVNVDRLLFTKVDEAESLRELVEAPARLQRPISYLTTGQRVPEDLELATREKLFALATAGFAHAEVAA
jgi:flagellar biosynthesis protein FlhF